MFYVYCIFRLDGTPCYVGKGHGNRWRQHFVGGSPNAHLRNIIKKEGKNLPCVLLAQNLTEQEAFDTEIAFIRAVGRRENDGFLVNMTDGGEGVTGLIHTEEAKEKQRAAHKGKKKTPEQIAAVREGLLSSPNRHMFAHRKGQKWSPEYLEHFSTVQKGKKLSPKHIASLSESRRKSEPTKKHCQDIAAKGAAAIQIAWKDPVRREQMLKTRRRGPWSDEAKKNMSEARKAWWARKSKAS